MTNSSPQPPENESRKKPILDLDEKVAVIVAFSTIGAILFWSLGSDLRKEILSTSGLKNSFSGWTNSLLSSSKTTDNTDLDSIETVDSNNIAVNKVFSEKIDLEAQERPSKYLDRQLKIKDVENLDGVTAFTSPTKESFGLAAPVAGGLALGKEKIQTPDLSQSKTPDLEPKVKTPEVKPKTPDLEPKVKTPETPDLEPKVKTPDTKPETPKLTFTDVTPDYWAYPFIAKLGTDKLVLGNSQSKFEPDKLITRASMATLISQSFTQPQIKKTKNFTDMPSQKEIAADIDRAVSTGFMHGYSHNEFRPLENIPRYQVLVTLATGLGLKSQDANKILGQFNDIDGIPDWAKEQIAAATEAGLAVNRPGFSANSLKPNEPATRAEVAAMIHQALVKLNKLESIDSQYIVKP